MPRYILIDNNSGYIFGDTASLPNDHVFKFGEAEGEAAKNLEMTPTLAAQWVDEAEVRAYGRSYELLSKNYASADGYHVYRADINGSDAVTTVYNGQDEATIRAVVDSCEYVGFVRCRDAA